MNDFCGYSTLKDFLLHKGHVHCKTLDERKEALDYLEANTPYKIGFPYVQFKHNTELMYLFIANTRGYAIHMSSIPANYEMVIEYSDIINANKWMDGFTPPTADDLLSLFCGNN